MPTIAPITGNTTVGVTFTSTLSCATDGGTWSSSNTAIATVSGVGVVTGISKGTASIIYTVGADSMSTTVTITQRTLSNGFDVEAVLNGVKYRVLWQSQGVTSQSYRYFEDFHILNDTSIIEDVKNDTTQTLTECLDNLQRAVVLSTVNKVYSDPQAIDLAKMVFFRTNQWVLYPQPVANRGQFVGLRLGVAPGDFAVKINSLELFFDTDCTFTMYLYNDMTYPPVYSIEVTALANQQVIVDLSNDAILNYLSNRINKGGMWYFGYYQEDIEAQNAQAMYYPIAINRFRPVTVWAFSGNQIEVTGGQRYFQRNQIGQNNLTYGLNMEITTYVDMTENILRNNHLLDNLLGLQMAAKIVEMIVFSYRSNGSQRTTQSNTDLAHLYEELNLAKPSEEIPYSIGLRQQIMNEFKRVKQGLQKTITRIAISG